jgi:hypothetical protein
MPEDDFELILPLVTEKVNSRFDIMKAALQGDLLVDDGEEILRVLMIVAKELIDKLRQRTSVFVVLLLEAQAGNSGFRAAKAHTKSFWSATDTLSDLVNLADDQKSDAGTRPARKGVFPVSLLVVTSQIDSSSVVASNALANDRVITLSGLCETGSTEYTAACFGVPVSILPTELSSFIYSLSSGNPLYIREIVMQLLYEGHVQVEVPETDTNRESVSIRHTPDLESLCIANWKHTAMIGETVSKLESFPPLVVTVLKTCSTLSGAFALPDLTATICPRFHGWKFFDNLRVHRALRELLQQGYLRPLLDEEKPSKCYDVEMPSPKDPESMLILRAEWFELQDELMKRVAASLLSPAQRRVKKRQAMVQRMISQGQADLWRRNAITVARKHIPWYYEDILIKPRSSRVTRIQQ